MTKHILRIAFLLLGLQTAYASSDVLDFKLAGPDTIRSGQVVDLDCAFYMI